MNKKYISVAGVNSHLIYAPRGCAGIRISVLSALQTRIPRQDSRASLEWMKEGDILSEAAGYAVKMHHVTKTFGKVIANKDVNLELKNGEILALLGENGSGKTTMIKIMNGLLTTTEGEVLINGMKPGIETKKIVSYLPERTYLNDWMKVKDIIDFFKDFYEDFDKVKALQMLRTLEIDENRRLKTLSKGTKEKVQLILVMARKADLYILDEPIGGVDPAARSFILDTILKNFDENSTLLIATHLISEIENICDEVIFLAYGEIVLQGDVDEIRAKKQKSIDALFREEFRC